MNTPQRSLPLTAVVAASLLSLSFVAADRVSAQTATATTDPVGFTTASLPANSDTNLGIPFTRALEFAGAVQSVSGNVVTISGTPGWSANQFVYAQGTQPKTYYVQFLGGRYYTVTSNGTNTLTLDTGSGSLGSVAAGTRLQLIPYWTLGTAFPAGDAGKSFTASPNAFNRATEILFPNHAAAGVNATPAATYYFFNGAWRQFGQPVTQSSDDTVLLPDSYFTVRNNSTASAGTFTPVGAVVTTTLAIPLNTQTSAKQDNYLVLPRPVATALNDSGLISSGAFVASSSAFNRADELLVFDNNTAAIRKSPTATYYYFNGAWRQFGQPVTTDFGTTAAFSNASGFIIRKAATSTASPLWVNAPTY